jgi:LacI family transcriptional regulator
MTEQDINPPLTLKDIARRAGVSLATVDRVLHNRPGVKPDTALRDAVRSEPVHAADSVAFE